MFRFFAGVVLAFSIITLGSGCTMPSSDPTGVCCQNDGSCVETVAANCTTNGTFNEGESCDEFVCTPSDSACCLEDGSCLEVTSDECDTANGTFNDGGSCDDTECPAAGACCLIDGSCEDSNSDDCAAQSGAFNEGEICDDVDCPQPGPQIGACCQDDGSCLNADSNGCDTVGGTFEAGTNCDAFECQAAAPAMGACCLTSGLCVDDSDANACGGVGGTLNEGMLCIEVQCEQPLGACCFVDATCEVIEADECLAVGGEFNQDDICSEVQCDAPSLNDIRDLAEEVEAVVADDLGFYIKTVSIIGREYWNLNGDDAEYTGELLGKNGSELDEDSELVTRTFVARYRAVRHCQSVINAVMNSDGSLSAEQENGVLGYARTMQAYSLLLALNHQFANGILPPSALGGQNPSSNFLDYTAGLNLIEDLLDDAAINLTNGGASFIFNLSNGFTAFATPATFRQFNRALMARVRIYQGDKAGSVSAIAGSFFNINGLMATGPSFSFDSGTPNPMYFEPDEDLYTVHPDVAADVAAGDTRLDSKSRMYVASSELTVPVTHDGLSGTLQVETVASMTSPFPIIRNEELILIYAEAQIGSDVNEVLAGINRVRNAAGLGNYLGATDDASLLNEVINQRRYSLFGEGHRWVDMRRTGKIGLVNIDRVGDVVRTEFPRPSASVINDL